MKLREIAHSRSGDKGDTSNISVIAFDVGDFGFLAEHVTADHVAQHFAKCPSGLADSCARLWDIERVCAEIRHAQIAK